MKVTSKKYRTNRKGYEDMYKLEASDVFEEAKVRLVLTLSIRIDLCRLKW